MIKESVKEAARILPVTWPIKSFIATNPLWDLSDLSFDEALIRIQKFSTVQGLMPMSFYRHLYDNQKINITDINKAILSFIIRCDLQKDTSNLDGGAAQAEIICQQLLFVRKLDLLGDIHVSPLISSQLSFFLNQQIADDIQTKMIKFFMFYFDEKNKAAKKINLYRAWSEYEIICPQHLMRDCLIDDLLDPKVAAIASIFQELKISSKDYVNYISAIFLKLIGWCSLIKCVEQIPHHPFFNCKASLIDVVLIWLCYERMAAKKYRFEFSQLSKLPISNNDPHQKASLLLSNLDTFTCRLLWQRAFEYAYERELLARLEPQSRGLVRSENTCSVQAIFCIDTRSEGLRYELEKIKDYDTYGFAGFFGFVFECQDAINGSKSLQCPALFAPDAVIKLNQDFNSLSKKTTRFLSLLQKIKKGFLSSFVFVEIFGYWYALLMMLKSFIPRFFQKILKKLGQSRYDRLVTAEISSQEISKAFTLEVKVNNGLQFLKAIGLVGNFAPLVFICGHGAETDNNPYQASLDCGACGGNAGFSNAKVACQILNDPVVRSELRIKGIDIPNTTYFIAGFHNTTRDDVVVSRSYLPSSLKEKLDKLVADLKKAASSLRQQRLKDMPGSFSAIDRSVCWSELIPEMGLINNAALIIAPRDLTRGLNLDRRVFLHSYDNLNDTDGQLLTAIFSGPLIVAHWINAQYYFSTTDPAVYGSGNKMLHNPLGVLGVMEGNFGDLKIGLPWQSVAFRDQILHQPLRLLVVVYAPQSRVDAVLANNQNIKAIFDGQWAHLKVIEPEV